MKLTINGTEYEVEDGKTLLEIAQEQNIEIPTLCSNKALSPYGSCRLCIVELTSDRGSRFVSACTFPVQNGLDVLTDSEIVKETRKGIIELLLTRCPEEEILIKLAEEYGVGTPRFKLKDDNCIFCGLCVRMCERMGVQAINFTGRGMERELGTPYMESSDVCMTCGACAFICPTSRFTHEKAERISGNKPVPIPPEFNEGMGQRHANYIAFPQAVPKIPVIDKENCVYYNTGNCKTCEEFCEADAIIYDQEDEVREIDVGSIIVGTGFSAFDPSKKPEYGHGRYENVVSSMEFERILSASGPTEGHVLRPSDDEVPENIAFIQCVGSRDEKQCREYCSSVCCMYAMKEAIIAQEHTEGLKSHIFFMDIRAFGKEFDDYYTRAEKDHGIEFTRCRIASIEENPKTKNLILDYIEDGRRKQKTFDMVVLSLGLDPPEEAKELSEKLGIELNEYGFCDTKQFNPLETSKPGIFVSGAFSSPKDIPMTVADASAAAAKASSIISTERYSLVTKKTYPDEIDVSGQEARIGVFVCKCGINIGSVVDVPKVMEYARSLPNVAYAEWNLYTCSQDTQENIIDKIKEHNLNRVVVASCTPRTHEPLFQDTIREAGLNAYLFEMANIRDQCSWVHMHEPEKATEKAKELVKMAVAKSRLIEPLTKIEIDVIPKGLVVGGGILQYPLHAW
jgi:heterodisulfide reductase subunit A